MAKLEDNTNTFSTISREVHEAENEHEELYKLVLHVAQKGNTDDVLKFCNCLHQIHPLLARVLNDCDEGEKAMRMYIYMKFISNPVYVNNTVLGQKLYKVISKKLY